MSDREFMRKLIDEVLGSDRNKLPDQSGDFGVKFTDERVCKHYLVGFCPYMQFQNTKSDIGTCPKRFHEEKHREIFLAEGGERYREEYERDFMAFLEKLVNDMERRLRRGRDRLDVKPNDPTAMLNPANDEIEEKRTILDLQIKELLQKIEECGESGQINEAQEMMVQVDRYKAELEKVRQMEAENPAYRLEKKMEVCQTCGAFLIVGDAQKRIEAHFEGRQHNGWAQVREALAELKIKLSGPWRHHHHDGDGVLSPQREPGEIGDEPPVDEYRQRGRDRSRSRSRSDRDYQQQQSRYGDRDRSRYDGSRDDRSRYQDDRNNRQRGYGDRGGRSGDRGGRGDRGERDRYNSRAPPSPRRY